MPFEFGSSRIKLMDIQEHNKLVSNIAKLLGGTPKGSPSGYNEDSPIVFNDIVIGENCLHFYFDKDKVDVSISPADMKGYNLYNEIGNRDSYKTTRASMSVAKGVEKLAKDIQNRILTTANILACEVQRQHIADDLERIATFKAEMEALEKSDIVTVRQSYNDKKRYDIFPKAGSFSSGTVEKYTKDSEPSVRLSYTPSFTLQQYVDIVKLLSGEYMLIKKSTLK